MKYGYGEVERLVTLQWWHCKRKASCVMECIREMEGLVSVERWSCSRGASWMVEYTGEVEGLVSVERGSCATQMNKKLHQKVIPCAYPTVQVE